MIAWIFTLRKVNTWFRGEEAAVSLSPHWPVIDVECVKLAL